ncbi:MAG: TIGR02281 family clan AA aspartic protease [Candidatus Competibacteraceae bacterium]|nr:TIGR02281 family clan AA aspartic protease [Candidatus Competibacteraceae bacterium]
MSQAQQRLGRWMIILAWVGLLGLLTLLFDQWLEGRNYPNRDLEVAVSNGVREVRLQRNAAGHYLAPGAINGYPVRFLLDTGASNVTVPAELAHRLELDYGPPLRARTANGTITVYLTQLRRVALGPIELAGVRASINPHMEGETVLLGMSFMRELELIQRGGVLTLRQDRGISSNTVN